MVGRVGRPHGLDGAFFVEERERRPRAGSRSGARLLAGGSRGRGRRRAARRRRAAGDPARPAGRARRAARGSAARRCRRPRRASTTSSSSSGSRSSRRAGAVLGRVVDVHPGPRERRARPRRRRAAAARRGVCPGRRPRGGAYPCRSPASPTPTDSPLRLDVFTLVPHAFAWLTEQRPVAAVLGGELDLRLFSYRDTTPARRAAASTTSRTAAAPGWCCASTSSRRRSTPSTAGTPAHRVVALTPAGARS